jgi:hypothetical protein
VDIFDEAGSGGPLPAPAPGAPQNDKGPDSIVAIPLPAVEAGIKGLLAVGLVYASQQCTG